MKRHPHLVRLSREHHAALRLGRHLLAGGAAAELRAEHVALVTHFAEEERELAPCSKRAVTAHSPRACAPSMPT